MSAPSVASSEDGQASTTNPGARPQALSLGSWQGCTTLLAGALCVLLGSVVLLGWHTHSALLIQVRPEYTPMVYNTALCFVLGGIALLARALGRSRFAVTGGALVGAGGALVLLQYVLGLDLGIDRFLMDPYITVETQQPGRMAPNTALCFTLAGLALAVMSAARRRRWQPLLAGLLGAVVMAVAANGLSGYFTGIRSAYGWGPLVPMAIHTALGLLVLGTGIVAWTWLAGTAGKERFPRWSPLMVGVAVATLTVGQWQAATDHDHSHVAGLVASEAAHLQREIAAHIDDRLESLVRMAHRFGLRPDGTREEWEADARLHLEQFPGYQALGWVDASSRNCWSVPVDKGAGALGVVLAQEERRRVALESSLQERRAVLTRSIRFAENGRTGFVSFVPIFSRDDFLGWIAGAFDTQAFIDALLAEESNLAVYTVSIWDGDEAVYGAGEAAIQDQAWSEPVDIPLPGVTWRAQLWPTASLLERKRSFLPAVVLGTGLLSALLMAVAVHLAQRARLREGETRSINRALEHEVRERKLVEEARRQSEERLARVVETIADGIFIVDRDGQIVFANAMAERLVGLSRDRITQRTYDSPDWKLSTVDGRTFPPEELAVARALRTRAPVYGVEIVLDRPDGSRIVISVNAAPLLDASGAVTSVVASVSDVTRRKEVEQMKDTFVSTVSHELRTPLASLRGFAELMLQREFPLEKRREFLTIIHDESIRLTNLINDFLDIQRMESGRQVYDFRSVDLAPLCEATSTLFSAGEGRRLLQLELPEDLPAVRADPDRIRQVLSNLVSNAVKFSPMGSEVALGARRGDGEVVVWVSDRGIGIPADTLPRLFTKFFRADNKETRSIGGTGLGLAVVKEIVLAHGGRVWVESKLGEGSTFYLSLPEAEGVPPPALLPTLSTGCATDVVLVEDDQAFARLLCERLAGEGLSVAVSPGGEQALDLLRRSPPRLAILDIHLHGMLDGWDVLTSLKGDPVLRTVPLLVLSASEKINGRGLALAGADYILKPVLCAWLLQAAQGRLSSLSGKRVLVVDDDANFCFQVTECLTAQGDIEVVSAANGREALERIAERLPDLLLLDLLMPEVDGFEVLQRLRLDKRAANLPVLVITGKDLTLDDKAYIRQRMATLVRKQETSLDHIVDTVKQHLGSWRSGSIQAA